jgi:hypothetical protein
MNEGTQTLEPATGTIVYGSADSDYIVPVDPMDELQCDSCQ